MKKYEIDKLTALMRKLDYQFKDLELLQLALTHRSRGAHNYERLEFLGDSILGFVIAEWLYQDFPKVSEGKLSRMRSRLVRRETLAKVARKLNLSDYLILGEGELKSGGFNRDSILSDSVESIIGAIYLDSNFINARQFIEQNFSQHFHALSDDSTFKDAKSKLQEYLQKQGLELPEYKITDTSGQQHMQVFTVQCSLPNSSHKAYATAGSRRIAEQKSASKVLDLLRSKSSEKNNSVSRISNGR
ncbi:MAG: ribonuclease III [Acidiferrobacterales bacterium]|nr:ribonuclease III [Acidiferrobacterales bacterium]